MHYADWKWYVCRVELDVGKQHLTGTEVSVETKSGPAVEIRNLGCVFQKEKYKGRQLTMTNRFTLQFRWPSNFERWVSTSAE